MLEYRKRILHVHWVIGNEIRVNSVCCIKDVAGRKGPRQYLIEIATQRRQVTNHSVKLNLKPDQ